MATMLNNTFDLGTLKFWALGDRVLIQEDEFKSGYECEHCNGSGKAKCGECGGVGSRFTGKVTVRCPHCENGAITCPECNGKGGLLVAPETSQRRPTTGRVVSVGPGSYNNGTFVPTNLKVGDSVLYSNFAGYVIDLNRAGRPVVLRILHESEVLCALEGQLDLRGLRGKSEVAIFQS